MGHVPPVALEDFTALDLVGTGRLARTKDCGRGSPLSETHLSLLSALLVHPLLRPCPKLLCRVNLPFLLLRNFVAMALVRTMPMQPRLHIPIST